MEGHSQFSHVRSNHIIMEPRIKQLPNYPRQQAVCTIHVSTIGCDGLVIEILHRDSEDHVKLRSEVGIMGLSDITF
jgi:hypothetical protein